jgi:hypothetical protein
MLDSYTAKLTVEDRDELKVDHFFEDNHYQRRAPEIKIKDEAVMAAYKEVHGGMQKAKLSKYHTFLPSNIFQPGTPT